MRFFFKAMITSALLASTLQAMATTDAQLYAYAQANYPDIFNGETSNGTYQDYRYRYYAGSSNYLAFSSAGTVVVLGPATGNQPTAVGSIASFADAITNWEASAPGLYPVVDTNQTGCYASASGMATACIGSGQDADFTRQAPSYSLESNGQWVTDKVTGLTWLRSSDTNGDGVVNYADKKTPSEAASYCSSLANGGHTWRLPSIKELYSLIQFSGRDASSYAGTSTAGLTPFIDPVFDWTFGDQSAGDRIIDAQYATSTRYVWTTMGNTPTMFGVNFVDGRIKGYPANNTKKYYVRCVTGNTGYGIAHFSDNSNGTITDRATGLMWEQNDHPAQDWDSALSTCARTTTGGYSGWRLPNAKELHSILDYSRSPDTTHSAAIDPLFHATPITNEGGATDWGYYWSSTTHVTNEGNASSAVYIAFGRGLGYFTTTPGGRPQLTDVHGAGTQRSDHKVSASATAGVQSANLGYGTFYYHGPQGDIVRSRNLVRCVR